MSPVAVSRGVVEFSTPVFGNYRFYPRRYLSRRPKQGMADRVAWIIRGAIDRWRVLDSDWQGVFVGATVVAAVALFGVTIPW